MRTQTPPWLPIFRSESQLKLLALILLDPRREHTAAEVERATRLPPASVNRELKRATDAGILRRDASARPHRYSAAVDSPVYEPLSALLERTVGVEVALRDQLRSTEGVDAAAIHGSWAAGDLTPTSDVDLVVVGTADGRELRTSLRRLGRELGRRIDLTLVSERELRSGLAEANSFLTGLLAGPLIPLVGELPGSDRD